MIIRLLLQSVCLALTISLVTCQLNPYTLQAGQAVFVERNSSSSSDVNIFCYGGTQSRPWHVWRTVELFIAFSSSSTESDDFQYFVSETVSDAYNAWHEAQAQSTPIVDWLSQLLLKLPAKLLFSSGGSKNTTLDRLLSSPPSVALYPFQPACVAVSSQKSYTATLHVAALSPLLFFLTLLGVAAFLAGPFLVSADLFYYISSSGLGVISCALIFVIVLFRYMPMRRPFAMSIAVIGSSALWVGLARRILEFLSDHLYIASLCVVITALIGFAFGYYYGPPSSPRVKNLVNWGIQFFGLSLIVFSTMNIPIVSALIVLLCLAFRNRHYFVIPWRARWMLWRVFPFRRKLLTEEEFERQGREETKRQVDALRYFVNSPECNTWELVRRLKDPVKFAKFVSPHTTPMANGNGNGHFTPFFDDDDSDDELALDDSEEVEDGENDDVISSDED